MIRRSKLFALCAWIVLVSTTHAAREMNGTTSTIASSASVTDFTGDWTIALWFRRDSTGRIDPLYSRWTNSTTNRQLYVYITTGGDNNKIQVDVPFVAAIMTSSITITDTTWHHLVVRRNGTAWTLWIDGVQRGSATSSTTQETGGAVQLGHSTAATTCLDGHIGGVAAWDDNISDSDIEELAMGHMSPSDIASLAYYVPMTGDAANEDEIVGNFDATISNCPVSYPRLFYGAAVDEVVPELGDWQPFTAGGGTANESGGEYTSTSTNSGTHASGFVSRPRGQFELDLDAKVTSGSGVAISLQTYGTMPVGTSAAFYSYLSINGTTAQVHYFNTSDTDTQSGADITIPAATYIDVNIRRELGRLIWVVNGATRTIDEDDLLPGRCVGHTQIVLGDSLTGNEAFTGVYRNMAFTADASLANPYFDLKGASSSLRTTLIDAGHAGQNAAIGYALQGLRRDLRAPGGSFTSYTIDAGNPNYDGLFMWDTYWAFILLRQVGANDVCKDIFQQFIDRQEVDGRIPQLFDENGDELQPAGVPFTQPYPCRMAYLLSYDGDVSWIDSAIYQALEDHLAYWESDKLSARDLPIIKEGREGWDGFVAVFPSPQSSGTGPIDDYEWIGHSCSLYLEYLAMAGIAKAKGNSSDHTTYLGKANALKTLIQTDGWDDTNNWPYAWDIAGADFREKRQADACYMLYAGVATTQQAQELRDFFMDPTHFLRPGGVTSLDTTDADYGIADKFDTNWNKPCWFPIEFMLAHGLNRYGFSADAEIVAALAYQRAVMNRTNSTTLGTLGEWHDPETGRRAGGATSFTGWHGMAGSLPKQIATGWNPTYITDSTVLAAASWEDYPLPSTFTPRAIVVGSLDLQSPWVKSRYGNHSVWGIAP